MSKIVDIRSKGLVLSILFSFAIAFNASASTHMEAAEENETILVTGNTQDEEWAEATSVPILHNKRYSQYAIYKQLEN